MERIVRAHWPAARDKGIDLHLLIDRQLPANWVTDPRCLRQVLDNLLANAVKFTQHGHVMLEARRSGEAGVGPCGLELRVTDTGSGIAPGDKGRIYALHEQGNQQAGCEFGGSGLGLAICSHLARRLGASLGHEPCSGGGVRFTLSLPLAGRSIDELPLRFQPKLLKSQRCLIALKDPANSVALNLLDRMGIETECARYWQPRDGAASFDAVFCDSVQAVEWGWKMQGGSKSCRPLLLWRERAEDSLTPGESCEFKWLELPQPMLHSNLEPLMLQLALQRKLQQPDPQ
jgi:hypothetical protein